MMADGDAPRLSALLMDHPVADSEPLLHGTEGPVTAGQARAAAADLARRLTEAGLGAGEGVAVQRPNGPGMVIAMTAVWLAGGVFIPVNPRHPPAEVTRIVDSTRPRLVLEGDELRPAASDVAGYDPDTAFVLWTSGTTGRPKPVLHTHRAYLELIDRVLGPLRGGAARPERRPMPNLIPVSLALNAGLYNALFGLRAGAELVIMERFEPEAFASLVAEFQIRSTVLPPAAMAMLLQSDVAGLEPLRYVRSITAPLAPALARRFMDRFGVFVLNSYGQAELGEVIGWTAADAKAHPEKLGAAGRPHQGVDIRVDPGSGELLVRPPNRASGYASGDDIDDRLTADGYVRTGDIARIDQEGFVWIEGRVGDVINRGGNKIFPAEVEEVLMEMQGVRDVAVAGVPDERLGEVPVAFVVAGEGFDPAGAESHCREWLVAYKVPVRFDLVEEIPRSEVGKVLRQRLVSAAG